MLQPPIAYATILLFCEQKTSFLNFGFIELELSKTQLFENGWLRYLQPRRQRQSECVENTQSSNSNHEIGLAFCFVGWFKSVFQKQSKFDRNSNESKILLNEK